ncbi:MAG TPA: TetR/AcrR family transcriptional regulator [Candidatus Corynebacterium avicola]|uniref:TetR/AcrR family transcriptional regulator n=1 Tax=Candidatus Corynebacterium avicola TaxID=2838527 RepID=A0A9D1RMN5_9CORY|nr:TetR/AcrR family transcriptional regulator [Candidatus Corynebacterium avicola]
MPKIVDPEQRRRQILNAALDLVVTKGVDGLSFRTVAEESGLNVGSIRNTYPTQHDLLAAAAEDVGDSMGRRLEGHDLSGTPGTHTVTTAAAAIGELLPLDEERRRENIVLGEFMMASRSKEVYRNITDRMSGDMQTVVTLVLTGLGVASDRAPQAATAIKTLMVGMTFDASTSHGALSPDEMTTLLTEALQAASERTH